MRFGSDGSGGLRSRFGGRWGVAFAVSLRGGVGGCLGATSGAGSGGIGGRGGMTSGSGLLTHLSLGGWGRFGGSLLGLGNGCFCILRHLDFWPFRGLGPARGFSQNLGLFRLFSIFRAYERYLNRILLLRLLLRTPYVPRPQRQIEGHKDQ